MFDLCVKLQAFYKLQLKITNSKRLNTGIRVQACRGTAQINTRIVKQWQSEHNNTSCRLGLSDFCNCREVFHFS
jgi:hypothetical protein